VPAPGDVLVALADAAVEWIVALEPAIEGRLPFRDWRAQSKRPNNAGGHRAIWLEYQRRLGDRDAFSGTVSSYRHAFLVRLYLNASQMTLAQRFEIPVRDAAQLTSAINNSNENDWPAGVEHVEAIETIVEPADQGDDLIVTLTVAARVQEV